MLFKHSSKRNPKDTLIPNALNKGNRRVHRAWVLKDEFEHFWDYKATWAAKRYLKRWTTTALKSRLQPMRDFVSGFRHLNAFSDMIYLTVGDVDIPGQISQRFRTI